jgi:hypothetical protein
MTDLTSLESQVAYLLQDSTNVSFTTGEIDTAIRSAMADLSQVSPVETETVITLASSGREIILSPTAFATLAGLTGVHEVWWPWYTTGGEVWPPNRVAGFRLRENAGVYTLFLFAKDGSQPKSGDKVRLWWTKPHTINTLDSATVTTLTTDQKSLVAIGAAGYAAGSGSIDRSEVIDVEVMRKWGNTMLADFRSKLEKIRSINARTRGEPFGQGWPIDKWDKQL